MKLENFELEHMDIEQSGPSMGIATHNHSNHQIDVPHDSIVLDELSKQVEDLQTKLKLSYRKLFLFETENQKITKEKNFFFYEKSNLEEQLKITSEKAENLFTYSKELEQDLLQTTEKMNAYENLNETQAKDLRRLTKFYSKIQDVIKPYVQKMKTDLATQETENTKLSKVNFQYLELTEALNKTNQELTEKNDQQARQFEFEKKNIVSSYEEQIHFLSKEIVEFQQQIAFAESEILRLKKSNETKNFIENELVKFKRTHSEDQNTIGALKIKQNEMENCHSSVVFDLADLKNKFAVISEEHENQKTILDATRRQLTQKIEDNERLELRLKMLERLNSHLSIGVKAQNSEEHQITL